MRPDVTDAIEQALPADGSAIGNGAMKAKLREQFRDLTDAEYDEAKEALVRCGTVAKGRGRGASVFRLDPGDAVFQVQEAPVEASYPPPKAEVPAARRKTPSRAGNNADADILSDRHNDKRVNNPEVGTVHAASDPDADTTRWAYDRHLDPTLNFDSARAGIERLIDDALESGDSGRMRDALQELKRLQAPYLNWTGRAEKTSFEVDTVSLPFAAGDNERIAVKIVDDRGIESLKILPLTDGSPRGH